MALVDLIDESVVKTPLVSLRKEEILRELIELLKSAGKVSDSDLAYAAVLERKGKGSTGLEEGIAVPHAKTPAVQKLTMAIGMAPQGIDFEALDGNPSQIFFLLLAPPDQPAPHIEALAEIARLCRSKAFCRLLLSARNPKEVVEIFKEE